MSETKQAKKKRKKLMGYKKSSMTTTRITTIHQFQLVHFNRDQLKANRMYLISLSQYIS